MANNHIPNSKSNYCLICNVTFKKESPKVENLDAIFLLRILLEVPQDSELLKSLTYVQICEQCGNTIEKCKQIYEKISEDIGSFWEYQNKILESFSSISTKQADNGILKDDSNQWIIQCRNFVKDHDFTGFGYPFVLHDLETLLTLSSLTTNDGDVNSPISKDANKSSYSDNIPNLTTINTTDEQGEVEIKSEVDSEIEDDDNYKDTLSEFSADDNDNDSDYEPSPSKKLKTCKNIKKFDMGKISSSINKITKQIHKGSTDEDKYERNSNTKKFHCSWPECPKQFTNQKDIVWHMDKHRGTPRQKCDQCDLSFYTIKLLLGHKKLKHENGEQRSTEEDTYQRNPKTKKYHCYWPECTQNFVEKKSIIWHMDKHRGTPRQKCDQCDISFYTKPNLWRHQQIKHGDGVKFECSICGENFECRAKLHHHRTTKHSTKTTFNKPVICEICGKSVRLSNLDDHVKRLHGEGLQKKFCCHLCPNVFEKGISLKMHLWRIHEFCESDEVREQLFKINKRRRETEGRWKCGVKGCGDRFATEEGLKCHMDKKHDGREDGGEGKLKCEICGKGFHANGKLREHLKVHSSKGRGCEGDKVCVICGWCHKTEKGLQGHMTTVHDGEEVKPRPFGCSLCTKRFISKAYLNYHKKNVHKLTKEEW